MPLYLPLWPSGLPCPLITATSNQGASFIRSEFDFDTRQRKTNCAKPQFSVSFNMDQAQYDTFLSFYEDDLFQGSREFEAAWIVHGIVSSEKVIRFITPFQLTELKGGLYKISSNCELLEKGE